MRDSLTFLLASVRRIVFVTVVETLLLALILILLAGVNFAVASTPEFWARVILIALVLGVANLAIRPIVIALRIRPTLFAVSLPTVLINFVLLSIAFSTIPEIQSKSELGVRLFGALVLGFFNTALTAFLAAGNDITFLLYLLDETHRGRKIQPYSERPRGMLLLEIDGLAVERLRQALARKYMPGAARLLNGNTHIVSPYNCGIPSQTSSCQAGIMYGRNSDIAAFRWYDKKAGHMYVSNNPQDANALDQMERTGSGLLRGGSSIANLTNGDAFRSVLTLASLSAETPPDLAKLNETDLNAFWTNPYFFNRTLLLTFSDFALEIFQMLRQRLLNRQPRLNRLAHAYPLLRVLTNVFLRDLQMFIVMNDMVRGAPVIYTTFVGYDEVAHHAGPETSDALTTLRGFDTCLREIQIVNARLATRAYDIFILSDHGQSTGATFQQRYGKTLGELTNELMQPGTTFAAIRETGEGQMWVDSMLAELGRAERDLQGYRRKRFTMRGSINAIQRSTGRTPRQLEQEEKEAQAIHENQVVVCVSGNFAHIYLTQLQFGDGQQASLQQIQALDADLVQKLAQHEGIGYVVVHDASTGAKEPVVIGKRGARNLVSGAVTGEDPLGPYGDVEVWAAQLLKVAQFHTAGDLIVNSTLYPDGRVAAFEDLVGSHGGMGGPQTHAFILHPRGLQFDATAITNATDVFRVLEQWREQRGIQGQLAVET